VYEIITQKILPSALGSACSLLGAWLLILWQRRRYGGWSAELWQRDSLVGRAELGWHTARGWLTDPWHMKLGLKSLCSDHGVRLGVSVLTITTVDHQRRVFAVQLPPPPEPNGQPVVD
jgi:hypothetical protein